MKRFKRILLSVLVILLVGFLIPEKFSMPVSGAGKNSYNQQSFWAYPWGTSVTHKGVDIFSKEGTDVIERANAVEHQDQRELLLLRKSFFAEPIELP